MIAFTSSKTYILFAACLSVQVFSANAAGAEGPCSAYPAASSQLAACPTASQYCSLVLGQTGIAVQGPLATNAAKGANNAYCGLKNTPLKQVSTACSCFLGDMCAASTTITSIIPASTVTVSSIFTETQTTTLQRTMTKIKPTKIVTVMQTQTLVHTSMAPAQTITILQTQDETLIQTDIDSETATYTQAPLPAVTQTLTVTETQAPLPPVTQTVTTSETETQFQTTTETQTQTTTETQTQTTTQYQTVTAVPSGTNFHIEATGGDMNGYYLISGGGCIGNDNAGFTDYQYSSEYILTQEGYLMITASLDCNPGIPTTGQIAYIPSGSDSNLLLFDDRATAVANAPLVCQPAVWGGQLNCVADGVGGFFICMGEYGWDACFGDVEGYNMGAQPVTIVQ